MPLDNSCEQYKGNLVFVWPVIGFGWCRMNPQSPPLQPGEAIDPPSPFYARLLEFYYFADQIAAGIGIVEQSNHPCDKNWVAFCIRDRGMDTYNLTTNPGKFNVQIGENKPNIKISLDVPVPQWVQFEDSTVSSGLGYIATSDLWLTKKYAWLSDLG